MTFTFPVVTILLPGDLTVMEFALLLLPMTTSNSSPKVSFTDFGITEMILFAAGELFKSSVCAVAGLLETMRNPNIVKGVIKLWILCNLFTYLPIHPPSTVMVDPCK